MSRSTNAWAGVVPVAVVAFAGAAPAAQAQPAASVRVTVVDSTSRAPVPNAQIFVGASPRGQTDATGHALLRGLPAGQATLRVQRIGFVPQTRQVTITTNGTAEVEFVM